MDTQPLPLPIVTMQDLLLPPTIIATKVALATLTNIIIMLMRAVSVVIPLLRLHSPTATTLGKYLLPPPRFMLSAMSHHFIHIPMQAVSAVMPTTSPIVTTRAIFLHPIQIRKLPQNPPVLGEFAVAILLIVLSLNATTLETYHPMTPKATLVEFAAPVALVAPYLTAIILVTFHPIIIPAASADHQQDLAQSKTAIILVLCCQSQKVREESLANTEPSPIATIWRLAVIMRPREVLPKQKR